MPHPSRVWAFVVTVVAGWALALPVVYTAEIHRELGPFGSLIAWTTVSVSIFGILTVFVSVVRAFVAPALQDVMPPRGKNGSL